MSTRSSVHVIGTDGKIRSIYVHFDGYEEDPGVGYHLRKFYNSQELADGLVAMGDTSSIGKDLEDSTFYNRDRDEDWDETQFHTFDTLDQSIQFNSQEYDYVWENGSWRLEQ